jgi:hypothetical protein
MLSYSTGGRVFVNYFGAAEGALIRAAASTQPFGAEVKTRGVSIKERNCIA